jgi:hypothetical protein
MNVASKRGTFNRKFKGGNEREQKRKQAPIDFPGLLPSFLLGIDNTMDGFIVKAFDTKFFLLLLGFI